MHIKDAIDGGLYVYLPVSVDVIFLRKFVVEKSTFLCMLRTPQVHGYTNPKQHVFSSLKLDCLWSYPCYEIIISSWFFHLITWANCTNHDFDGRSFKRSYYCGRDRLLEAIIPNVARCSNIPNVRQWSCNNSIPESLQIRFRIFFGQQLCLWSFFAIY